VLKKNRTREVVIADREATEFNWTKKLKRKEML